MWRRWVKCSMTRGLVSAITVGRAGADPPTADEIAAASDRRRFKINLI
jgi:hypothetical protein